MPDNPLVGACVRGAHGYSLARMGVWLAKRLAGRSQSPQPRTKRLLKEKAMTIIDRIMGREKRFPDCVESVCRHDMRHRPCHVCGDITDSRMMIIQRDTLRRKMQHTCTPCSLSSALLSRQNRLREERTKRDWEKVTDPLSESGLKEKLPEQYSGKARSTVRAFYKSGAEFAAAEGIDAATLGSSISALGLDSEVYVEIRSGETVLRREQGDV